MNNMETVVHCNVEKNARLIAQILDFDVNGMEYDWYEQHLDLLEKHQPHWVSVEQPPKDKQECFVAYKGPLGFVYDTGRFYDDLNSGLDEDIFEDGTSGFVLGGDVGYALGSIDYWMPIEPPQEDA